MVSRIISCKQQRGKERNYRKREKNGEEKPVKGRGKLKRESCLKRLSIPQNSWKLRTENNTIGATTTTTKTSPV